MSQHDDEAARRPMTPDELLAAIASAQDAEHPLVSCTMTLFALLTRRVISPNHAPEDLVDVDAALDALCARQLQRAETIMRAVKKAERNHALERLGIFG